MITYLLQHNNPPQNVMAWNNSYLSYLTILQRGQFCSSKWSQLEHSLRCIQLVFELGQKVKGGFIHSPGTPAQLRPTLHDLMNCSLPGSSVHGAFFGRILELVAISVPLAFSCGLSAWQEWASFKHFRSLEILI